MSFVWPNPKTVLEQSLTLRRGVNIDNVEEFCLNEKDITFITRSGCYISWRYNWDYEAKTDYERIRSLVDLDFPSQVEHVFKSMHETGDPR